MEELKNICSIVHLSSHFSLPRDQTKEYKKQEINSSRDILNLEINKIFNLTFERLRNVPTFILARRSSRRKVRGMNQKRLTIPSINHQQVRLKILGARNKENFSSWKGRRVKFKSKFTSTHSLSLSLSGHTEALHFF